MTLYDEAIISLMKNEPELAILQIRQVQYEQRKAEVLREEEEFALQPDVSYIVRSTDFLPFQGWEAA